MTTASGLEPKQAADAGWHCEGMGGLAWALGRAELPEHDTECDPFSVAQALGWLADRDETVLADPSMRSMAEIEMKAATNLTLHWRLRNQVHNPGRIDLRRFAETCAWANLSVIDLEILDDDLALGGTPIARLDGGAMQQVLSITQERHRAFNGLLGFEPVYSQVTTDT